MICDRPAMVMGGDEEVVQRFDLAAAKVQLISWRSALGLAQPNNGELTSPTASAPNALS